PSLGADQEAAVRHLCGGEARVRVLEARAGTGKTFTLAVVREAYERSAVPVVGVAWQGQAADLLRREAGIAAETAARLLGRIERGEDGAIPDGAVIVVDEASAMPTRALERLIHAAAWSRARVVLVGDRGQLPAIEAGGGFAALADRLGSVELVENRRQATELQRRIAAHLADGRAADAVALLSESGRLARFEDAREARAALIGAWARAELDSPGRNLMLAHDRRDVADLNRLARQWRDAWGFLSDRRIVAGGREWAIGDRLVCRRNDYDLGVRNGTSGTVVGLDHHGEGLDLRTDLGEVVRLPAGYLSHASHGYALTGHVAQGSSVDRTFVLASPERGGAEWAYVAASRQRHDLHVFVVHHDASGIEDALARAWSRSQGKSLALDLVDSVKRTSAMDAARGNLEGATPERLLAVADELRVRRENARQEARGTANERLRRVEAARALERAESGLRDAERRLGRATEQLEQAPVWRRRERSDLRRHSARAREDITRHRVQVVAARDDLARLGPENDAPAKRAGRLSVELARVEERLARRGRGVPDRGREPPPPGIELSR
ncbi:MAG TPA: AAA family ATPase, partial [Miltoncostaeaceae bacterium]|nr:AAA family ATPase [Miltoncostaeaceae bacterium]